MKFGRKSQVRENIPTSSMADIAFLLLIFFMVTTVFKVYQGLDVLLPAAEKSQKIETKRNISHLWIDANGTISIDDMLLELPSVEPLMKQKYRENPRVIVSLKVDKRAKYGIVSDVMEELKKAETLRVSFASVKEKGGG